MEPSRQGVGLGDGFCMPIPFPSADLCKWGFLFGRPPRPQRGGRGFPGRWRVFPLGIQSIVLDSCCLSRMWRSTRCSGLWELSVPGAAEVPGLGCRHLHPRLQGYCPSPAHGSDRPLTLMWVLFNCQAALPCTHGLVVIPSAHVASLGLWVSPSGPDDPGGGARHTA